VILRFYESSGAAAEARVTLSLAVTAVAETDVRVLPFHTFCSELALP
jgi:hypothetical protein